MTTQKKFCFCGYAFAYNPKSIEIKQTKNIKETVSPLTGSFVQNLGIGATEVTGEVEFYEDGGASGYQTLKSLFQNQESGLLQIPGIAPFFAYFTSLSAARRAGPAIIRCSFGFTEDCLKGGVSI